MSLIRYNRMPVREVPLLLALGTASIFAGLLAVVSLGQLSSDAPVKVAGYISRLRMARKREQDQSP